MTPAAQEDVERLVRGELTDPHALLGAHPDNGGVIVRAYRPSAQSVFVRAGKEKAVELARVHPEGLFEGKIDKARLPLAYELEVAYPDGNTFTLRDPYAFPPTVGDVDLHLAGEGRHERIYERLGAHVTEDGVSFAVWAPNARRLAVWSWKPSATMPFPH